MYEPERTAAERVAGPPWILGHRGAPRECPENTLISLRRALELGLDGVEYDLHACQSGEPVLIHDETLDRTTNRTGPVAQLSLTELVQVDAGAWFSPRFVGEPLPLFEEALELEGSGGRAHHMIELKDPTLVAGVARGLARLARPLSVHVASFHRSVCLEARDAGLATMLLAEEASEEDRRFVRDERITAYGTGPGGWYGSAGRAEWSCERWSWSVDDPQDLLDACRAPLLGFNTNEPRRALATRALVRLAPDDRGAHPLGLPRLEVARGADGDAEAPAGEWTGRWEVELGVRNPFPFPVQAALALELRGGAFQTGELPSSFGLDPRAERRVPLSIHGGSWSPIEDPLVLLRLAWRRGRVQENLVLDGPLERVRTLELGAGAERLRLLRESPGDRPATMIVRRRGRELLAWVEDAGGLEEVHALIRVGARVRRGRRAVRIRLPEEPDPRGLLFSVGFEGSRAGGRGSSLRRWCGGLPYGLGAGAPGRLLLAGRA
jgi:glycerophosphoryl diester phosphodiesterase